MARNKTTKAKITWRTSVSLDFDGVLAEYHGWRGSSYWGKPLPGVKTFLQRLARADIDFVVCTTRKNKKGVLAWFKKYKLPTPASVANEKPLATVYVDDRSLQFNGDWTALTKQLKKFSVYWKRDHKPFKDL